MGHRILGGQVGLVGLVEVLAFVFLFARQIDRVFEEAQLPFVQFPGVVTVAMMALQDPFDGGTDLFRLLQLPLGHARLYLLQSHPCPRHRLLTHACFVGATLVTVDHEDAHGVTAANSSGDGIRPRFAAIHCGTDTCGTPRFAVH